MVQRLATGFMDWLDNRMIIRRIVLFLTMYLVLDSYIWAKNYAWLSTRNGSDIALVVVAVTAPVTLLLKFVLDNYTEVRK
jgi:hypothetical protein